MDFSDVTRLFKEDLLRVEETIRNNYHSDLGFIPGVIDHLMQGGGRRIRPLLLLLSTKICGNEIDEKVVKHACIVEYIHAATLLHDDVVDQTTLRRGNTTVNSKWGSDASILAGDFLISRAILLLADDCNAPVIRAIAQATKLLVEGGILEFTHARSFDVDEHHCLDVIRRKTASILSVSCEIGALLGNADPKATEALVSFGHDLGMAFQLVDDVMDYEGDEELLGKPPGNDLKEGHVTLPLLHLYQNADPELKKQIDAFVQNENLPDKELEYVVERMRETKSLEYSLDLTREYIERAKTALKSATFPSPEYLEPLIAVVDHILDRHVSSKTCS